MTSQIITSAPGKVILSGEHTVVHGYPALVAAVDIYAIVLIEKTKGKLSFYPTQASGILLRSLKNCETFLQTKFGGLNINLRSDIPVGCGMGSSASIAVAVAAALMEYTSGKIVLKKINDIAYETEKHYHGNPSGVDVAISTYGGFLWYRKETSSFKVFSKIKPARNLSNIILINSGKPQENTAQMVGRVSELYKKHPKKYEKTFQKIEKITKSFLRFILNEEDVSLIELIKENERLLESMGVVSDSGIELVRKIEKIGGAAKISGAGGRKGNSGILLAYHPEINKLLNFAKKMNIKLLHTSLGAKGVQIEKNNI
ncbi:MAG: Mevalonate kinase [Microgenomates group bacterium GW2011_GWC1_37_8]|uniref:mevalonate kinase n=1 Tax=Candidatus Woesebacteria bacterium GW2011_GWB1_38_8 TaxID=1618570 RepID=A0A0G0NJ91_9BACT|nr:MAG: Mevalonate kinase [Microgenomates group bacterium GW2011_GWC1_37_8]KKQ85984.1 MAG: Mevalonate kinase [Candidatus Woesebacteria bacterium GW2011_GWB1_38_8]